jgi:hypothetical protein
MNGAEQQVGVRREIHGSGKLRGVMATKYLNVVTRKHVSAGLAIGGGTPAPPPSGGASPRHQVGCSRSFKTQ